MDRSSLTKQQKILCVFGLLVWRLESLVCHLIALVLLVIVGVRSVRAWVSHLHEDHGSVLDFLARASLWCHCAN